MQKVDLFGYQVEIDADMTKSWYEKSSKWDCKCGYCRNFLLLASKKKLPPPVMEILDSLYIPPEKATYVCEIYPDSAGFCYQFSYRIAGRILNENGISTKMHTWGDGRCCHESYPYGAPNFPLPHFDLEFWVTLPWVLEENDEE